jgi:Flavodoxins
LTKVKIKVYKPRDMTTTIIYSSIGGNTELVVKKVGQILCEEGVSTEIFRVENVDFRLFEKRQFWVLASPTYHQGELEKGFQNFLNSFRKLNLENNKFAVVGLGDRRYYSEYLCDSAKILEDFVSEAKGELLLPSLRIGTNPLPLLNSTVVNWSKRLAKAIKSLN